MNSATPFTNFASDHYSNLAISVTLVLKHSKSVKYADLRIVHLSRAATALGRWGARTLAPRWLRLFSHRHADAIVTAVSDDHNCAPLAPETKT
jgi:hypothetical protein